jgi:hypothetical protein
MQRNTTCLGSFVCRLRAVFSLRIYYKVVIDGLVAYCQCQVDVSQSRSRDLLPVFSGFGQFSGTSTTTQIAANVLWRADFSHRSTYTPKTLSNDLLTERTSMPVMSAISLDFKPSGCRFSKSRMMLWLLFKLHIPYIASKTLCCVAKCFHLVKLFSHFLKNMVSL